MFLLGQWKNFDDLEDSLTLNELVEIFNAMTERENRKMEFQAKMAGAEIKDSPDATEQASAEPNSLADRIRARQQKAVEEGDSEFAQGVGYTVIGG